MDLNDLLAEVEGIGTDRFIASSRSTAAPKEADADIDAPLVDVLPDELPGDLADVPPPPAPVPGTLDMVLDVELELTVELGELRLPLKTLMHTQPGDLLPLAQRPDEPLRIFVNDRLVAYGEALVVDGALAVKITEIITATL